MQEKKSLRLKKREERRGKKIPVVVSLELIKLILNYSLDLILFFSSFCSAKKFWILRDNLVRVFCLAIITGLDRRKGASPSKNHSTSHSQTVSKDWWSLISFMTPHRSKSTIGSFTPNTIHHGKSKSSLCRKTFSTSDFACQNPVPTPKSTI